MKNITANQMRDMWFRFWQTKDHEVMESASLVPVNDPTLLWINAGVTPLKKYFDGSVVPNNRRMCSSQKCIRTNDIENVGKTARHQTFFEMLGNFSIGDYFKHDAIYWSWEFLTSDEWLGLEKEKLYITVYPTDQEAYDTWIEVGVSPDHIIRLEDNFWEIGPGPSGPDSEIFYDRGEDYDPEHIGIRLLAEDIENDRYIEIWNNVFSQYNAKSGLSREEYPELPSKNIDTGMGLERIVSVLQGAETNFDTDLFLPIMDKISEISGKQYDGSMPFKVIADHVRTITLALADGANFGNNGRDYVLRRLLRRAVRYARMLGIERPFMDELVSVVVGIMEYAYPYLIDQQEMVMAKIEKEEELFHRTLVNGEKRLFELFETSSDHTISGEEAFKLYDTFGFPFELTLEYATEKGFTISREAFDQCMKKQKELARSSRKTMSSMNNQNAELLNFKDESVFVGYEMLECDTTIIALFDGEKFVDSLTDQGYVVLKETPFYAESGGQVSDTGVIDDNHMVLEVVDLFKGPNKQHFHYVKFTGTIHKGDSVKAMVNEASRLATACNHSTGHLLQEALRDVLGKQVIQAGAYMDDNTLRFDFRYDQKITRDDLVMVEKKVNEQILGATDTKTEIMTLDEAKASGAIALFDEKYGDQVRVVTIGNSRELCGGTHVKNTGDIEKFAIASIESKGSNVYRIEGATRDNIDSVLFETIKPYNDEMIKLLVKARKVVEEASANGIILDFDLELNHDAPHSYEDILFNLDELAMVQEKVQNLDREYHNRLSEKVLSDLSMFDTMKETINGVECIIGMVENIDLSILKQVIDVLSQNMDNGFVFIANVHGGSVNYFAKASASLKDKVNCGQIVKDMSVKSNGNGGGSSLFAQGGGKIDDVTSIIAEVKEYIRHA